MLFHKSKACKKPRCKGQTCICGSELIVQIWNASLRIDVIKFGFLRSDSSAFARTRFAVYIFFSLSSQASFASISHSPPETWISTNQHFTAHYIWDFSIAPRQQSHFLCMQASQSIEKFSGLSGSLLWPLCLMEIAFFFRNIKNFLLASITRCLMKLPFMLWSEGGDIASCQRHINWSSLKRYTHLTMCTRCCTKEHSTSHRDESFMLSLPEGMQLNIIDSHVIRLEIIELNFNRKWFASELRQSAFVGSTRSCNQVATVAEKSALHSRCSSKVFQITYKQSQLHFTRNLCTQKHKHKHTKSLFVLGGKSFFRQKRRSKTAPQCAFKLDHCMSLCGNHTINNMPVGSREEENEKN